MTIADIKKAIRESQTVAEACSKLETTPANIYYHLGKKGYRIVRKTRLKVEKL